MEKMQLMSSRERRRQPRGPSQSDGSEHVFPRAGTQQQPHTHTDQEWEEIKPRAHLYYVMEDCTLGDTIEKIKAETGFEAGSRTWKKWVSKWDWDKNSREPEPLLPAELSGGVIHLTPRADLTRPCLEHVGLPLMEKASERSHIDIVTYIPVTQPKSNGTDHRHQVRKLTISLSGVYLGPLAMEQILQQVYKASPVFHQFAIKSYPGATPTPFPTQQTASKDECFWAVFPGSVLPGYIRIDAFLRYVKGLPVFREILNLLGHDVNQDWYPLEGEKKKHLISTAQQVFPDSINPGDGPMVVFDLCLLFKAENKNDLMSKISIKVDTQGGIRCETCEVNSLEINLFTVSGAIAISVPLLQAQTSCTERYQPKPGKKSIIGTWKDFTSL
ncbi:hypothetical protein F4805DRAFT_273921 [Annulohypoxylon moriforme]|nr:hypothetical protein F4805DRAFT_273921 [Annulohypoxylon moriforme]